MAYHVTLSVAPSFTPVDTADLKTWLRLNDTAEDSLLPVLVSAASDKWTVDTNGHVLCASTFKLWLDGWPTIISDYRGDPTPFPYPYFSSLNTLYPTTAIYIPRAPVTEITTVEYLDPDATWQTLTGWTEDTSGVPARVILPQSLPTLHPQQRPAVRVTFTAGYEEGSVPAGAAVGVRLLASHWYTNREAADPTDFKEVPMGWFALTKQFDTGISGNWNK
jgi:hypothetical protein